MSRYPTPAAGDTQEPAPGATTPRSLLVVTTVSSTMGFLYPFVRHFRAQGWRVDGCARGVSADPRAVDEFDDTWDLPLSRSVKDVRGIAASMAAVDAALASGYDIVHVHTPIAAFVTRVAVRRVPLDRRPRLVYTAHGFHFHADGHPLTNAAFLTAERAAGRWTDRLVVINREDLEAARRHRIVPAHRLRHMPGIGVDTAWYSPANAPIEASRRALAGIGIDPARPYFVVVGELNRNKRPTDVVRALSKMHDREPYLVFLGTGPLQATVDRVAREHGVAERIVMPGRVEDVRPFISTAIALVQASKREGLPRSIMEALSLEVPVIASAARGSRELVGDDRGQVVPIGATGEMAAAMDRLAKSPELRAAMGRRGRQAMIERYDVRTVIREHERLYAELVADAGSIR